jgi:hypothetical protein
LPSKARARGRGRERRRHTAAQSAKPLATDAGVEGRACHLGAVCVNTLYASSVDLLFGKPAPPSPSAALCNGTALLAAMAAHPTATGFTSRVRQGRPEGLRAALRAARPPGRLGPPFKKGAARTRAARAGPKGGQGRARGRPMGPPCRPDQSVKCAGSSKTSSGDLFLPFSFGV